MKSTLTFRAGLALLLVVAAAGLGAGCGPSPTALADDAGGRKPTQFPELAIDVFQPMDGGIALSPDEIKGRNTWNLWCAGDEQFWDRMARESFGLVDLLKTIDSRHRSTRFADMGLINQPGFRAATKPDKYGLYIDEAVQPEPAGIDPAVYGRPTGVMGFRLFDNPEFVGDAVKAWDGEKYDKDPDYAVDPKLVRPYRVGVACGACHIAFNPCSPPKDPENPAWENLASAIGNQYIAEGRVFAHNVHEGGLFWEMLKAQPRGTSDTSRMATDHINNPNTINPIFELGARLAEAEPEKLAGETLKLPTVTGPEMAVPHVLKDGADSVGVAGATLRVYINIGSYSQHWLQQHQVLIGLMKQQPFSIEAAQQNSVYWLATQDKFQDVASFFKRLHSFRLEDAPGGKDFLTKDDKLLTHGKLVFAENCASCHSSKRPPAGADETAWFRQEVVTPDFLKDNFLSDDRRNPVTEVKTNAARASGTNAMRGHIWSNFSSETYKSLPSVGSIKVWNPYADTPDATLDWKVQGGGPGYYRTPTLISVWSSAPLLHNNALGSFSGDPSVAGRMKAFNDAIQKLLWPEKRLGKDSVWRTSQECALQIQRGVIPEPLRTLLASEIEPDGYFRLGPIPAGTPVNLIANINPDADPKDLVKLCLAVKKALLKIKAGHLDGAAAKAVMKDEVAPLMFAASTCPDLVEDRGHLYGTDLPDADKLALIEFLKTF